MALMENPLPMTPYRSPTPPSPKPPAPPTQDDHGVWVFVGLSCVAAVMGIAWILGRLPRLDGEHGSLAVAALCLAATARRSERALP